MKHNKQHKEQPLTGVLDTFYRSIVNNSGSKTLALSEVLNDFTFVRVEVLERKDESVTIRITEVRA